MSLSRGAWPLFSVSIERDMISVDIMARVRVPDPDWRYIDKAGHGHFWKGKKLPTLKQVVVGTQWVGDEYDGDEYDIKEWWCKLCSEPIEPGMREETPAPIPGQTWVTVTIGDEDYVVSPEQYAESVEAWEMALRTICTMRREPPISFDKTGERKR